MNLQSILTSDIAAVLLLITLLISSKRTFQHRLVDGKLFDLLVCITIGQCIFDGISFCLDGVGGKTVHILVYILNALLFLNASVLAYIWLLYTDYKLFGDTKRILKKFTLLGIPAAIIVVLSIVNIFTPIFFEITADNIYVRTDYNLIPYFVVGFYLMFGFLEMHRYKKSINKYLFMPALVFMCPIIIGSILQIVFYGYSFVWLGTAIGLVSLYINIQNEVAYIDPLSGLYTRTYMNQYLRTALKHANNKLVAGIMLDIDQFKQINDNYGHLVGDNAIRSVGRILHKAVPKHDIAVRYAGDEFVVIQIAESEDEIKETIRRIQNAADAFNVQSSAPYKLVFSVGYSIYRGDSDSIGKLFRRIDEKMYADKRAKSEN